MTCCWGQATSYLVTAWEALAAQQGKAAAELPVLFEDVSIVQAVPIAPGGSVTLSVILDASHGFQARLPSLAHAGSAPNCAAGRSAFFDCIKGFRVSGFDA